MADHAHDVPAGMQREGPRLAQQLHLRVFGQQMIALAPVAAMAAGHQVLPGGETAARARLHVVECEFTRIQHNAAILAGIPVA